MSLKIILCVTGSIAAYKSIDLAKSLLDNSFETKIILSKGGSEFVSSLTFRSLFPKNVYDYNETIGPQDEMLHISLAKFADYIIIAPASANIIAKLAQGYADCLISNICLATHANIIIAPAMNKSMWENKFVQNNIKILKDSGAHIIGPESGLQACGDIGFGRMANIDKILNYIYYIKTPKILIGKKIVITSGPTREKIDPVRFLSNYSSSKMGYAVARIAHNMGAEVTFITGPSCIDFNYEFKVVKVESTNEMLEAVKYSIQDADIFIGAAAVADYRSEIYSTQKIKKKQDMLNIKLVKNIDIIDYVKKTYPNIFCVGFAAETNDAEEYGYKKLKEKQLDMVAINDVSDNKVFGGDFNEMRIITKDEQSFYLVRSTKDNIALRLLEIIGSFFTN